MSKFRALQYEGGNVKYDEVYEGMTRTELVGYLDDLIGLAFDSYVITEL